MKVTNASYKVSVRDFINCLRKYLFLPDIRIPFDVLNVIAISDIPAVSLIPWKKSFSADHQHRRKCFPSFTDRIGWLEMVKRC
jgi:hypothetical protein